MALLHAGSVLTGVVNTMLGPMLLFQHAGRSVMPECCSGFVTGLTFWRGEPGSVKNSLALRGISGSERLPALRR